MTSKEAEKITINGKEYKQFADGKYDVVILGTGLTNSLLAAILSTKKSMSVLHIDVNSYYGGEGASLQLNEIFQHFGRTNKLDKDAMTKKFGNTRQYNIDLIPKLIMSSGKLIQFLVKANVQKYVDFNTLDASYVYQKGGTIGKVPATGGEAVSTNLVGFFQKRRLKNFLQMLHSCPKNQFELKETQVVDFKEGPLGLRLVPLITSTGCGSTVTAVNGQSKESGKINVGDILTHVAGKDVRGVPHTEILNMIKGASRPLAVSFQARPSGVDKKFDLVTHNAKELYVFTCSLSLSLSLSLTQTHINLQSLTSFDSNSNNNTQIRVLGTRGRYAGLCESRYGTVCRQCTLAPTCILHSSCTGSLQDICSQVWKESISVSQIRS
jgi:hypothetical protein